MEPNATDRLYQKIEELEKAVALAGKVQDEMGLLLTMERQKVATLDHALHAALDVAKDSAGQCERLRGENERLRDALQRYVDGDDCEYTDGQPDVCPGDPPYVDECHWHQARAALAATAGTQEGSE